MFDRSPVRGELVHLDAAWRAVLERHDYPPVLRSVLGELMAAAVLLAATLKLKGSLILQIQGKGPVTLLVVECDGDLNVRATAKWEGDLAPSSSFAELVGAGRFAITLDPRDGNQAYQGVVALDGANVAEVLQNYMLRSEQVETALWLAADDRCAAGLLLQRLPLEGGRGATAEHGEETWQRAAVLAATLRPEELLTLSAETLLHRLYHEDDVRLFEPQAVVFRCSCSREKVTGMLKLLGADEVHAALQELGELEVRCEFCNRAYRFDAVDVERIFAADVAVDGGKSLH